MKKKLLVIIVVIETLLIVFLSVKIISYNKYFYFEKGNTKLFQYSFDFFFSKSRDTHGSIIVGEGGNYESIYLQDKDGIIINIAFDKGKTHMYRIKNMTDNYEMMTWIYPFEEYKTSIFRVEKLNGKEQIYYIDYEKSPFFFFKGSSEYPIIMPEGPVEYDDVYTQR